MSLPLPRLPDYLDLDSRSPHQELRADRGTSRPMIAEEPRMSRIEAGKILHTGQPGRGLDYSLFRRAGLG